MTQEILNATPDANATPPNAAIFYSISATQKGLAQIDLGNFLIKRVVSLLQSEFAATPIQEFCTLSPIPGFASFVRTYFKQASLRAIISESDFQTLAQFFKTSKHEQILEYLEKDLEWTANAQVEKIMKLMCARYIFHEKKRGCALDPVANFHLRNGACVYRINTAGDLSLKGRKQSFGFMINYQVSPFSSFNTT